nr:probable homogentisate phytyltransferase 1, chloroplastic [Oryza sativa Japonica Group]
MDLVRLRPSLLAARGPRCGLAAASPASQRTQGPSFDQCQKFFGWESSHHRIPHRPTTSSADASGQPLQSSAEAHDHQVNGSQYHLLWTQAWFSRPHTVIGTALSIVSVSLLAVENLSDVSPLFLTGLLEAVVAALFMNIYIVGLNQLFDIEIDKVNKPTLPLASVEYSPATGVALVSAFAAMSFGLGWAVGSQPLFRLFSLALFL